jgi:hypothetical protein
MSMSLQEPKCGPYIESTAIEICNTLKTEGRKRFLTLCTVEVASRAICPLNMDNINGSTATWQSGHTVATAHTISLGDIFGHVDVLVFHVDDSIEEHIIFLHTSDVHIEHNDRQEQNAAPVPNR